VSQYVLFARWGGGRGENSPIEEEYVGMITTNDDLGGGIKLLQGNTAAAYVSKTWRGRDFGVVERA